MPTSTAPTTSILGRWLSTRDKPSGSVDHMSDDESKTAGEKGSGEYEARRRIEQRLEDLLTDDDDGVVGDLFRRAFGAGVRTYRKGNESVRNMASDILNSDRVEASVGKLNNVRSEIVTMFGRELVSYFDRLNFTDEMVKLLTAISLEVKTEIRFIPNDKKLVSPDVKASIKVKDAHASDEPEEDAAEE
ncbi:MAG: hypothetical protein ACI9OJ_005177 [Myxococcota bacterium]|jgi:hypothetical protein